MKLATGNMFTHPASLTLVTTNSYVRRDGSLVMGRGAASQLKRYYPECERVFGAQVSSKNTQGNYPYFRYGVLTVGPWGIFQVKYHWGKPALPELIEYSVRKLCEIAPNHASISLNFPGIGNGGLTRESVLPLLEKLPENVTIWELL